MNLTRKGYTKGRQSAIEQARCRIDTADGCPTAAPLPCRSYLITLIHGSERTVRHIIAHSAMQAVSIGINMLPDTAGPVSLFCKPAERNFHVA